MKSYQRSLILSLGLSWACFAQVSPDYTSGSSKILKFGNGSDGMYSSSYLSPVGQGGAGADPKEVKTEFGFGFYSEKSKTAYDLGQESLKDDQVDLDLKYQDQIFKLFENNYFPDSQWNGTPLVEKVYAIIEGIRGNPDVALQNAQKHRKLKLTNIKDLELWGQVENETDLRKKYISEYQSLNQGIYPSEKEIQEFINIFFAIRNSVTWAGLCHQFSAANADPFINHAMSGIYERSGEVFLCQKPITLGEVKEATTMLYDKIEYDEMKGGKIAFNPHSDPTKNFQNVSSLDFMPGYEKRCRQTGNKDDCFISGEKLQEHAKDYSTYVYQNYFERNGKNPTGLDFCDLDQTLSKYEHQTYSSQSEMNSKNKVPIMNLSGNGEVWNNPITGAARNVRKHNIYTGHAIQEEGQPFNSNSFTELIQVFVDKKLKGESGEGVNRLKNLLLKNYSVMCNYAIKNNMESAKIACNQMNANQVYYVPSPTNLNANVWSKFPQELATKNLVTDYALFNLAKSFVSMETYSTAYKDAKGLPRIRSTDVEYFNRFKFQDIDLKLQYIDQTSFADDRKTPTSQEISYSGVVLIDEGVSPPEKKGCSWKNVWNFNANLKRYESKIPASFMTLDIPSCPNDTDAVELLDKVGQCLTFKELVSKYNEWMLEASTGYEGEASVVANINVFKEKFPETKIDWEKLKRQIIKDFDQKFIEENDE
jgi:hypothetical protein